MKKNILIIVVLVVVLIAVGFIFRNSQLKEEIKVSGDPSIKTGELIVDGSYDTKVITEDDPYVTFDVSTEALLR